MYILINLREPKMYCEKCFINFLLQKQSITNIYISDVIKGLKQSLVFMYK